MSRLILQRTKSAPTEKEAVGGAVPSPSSDSTYPERVAKYIPGEVLAAYIGVGSYIPTFTSHQGQVIAYFSFLVFCLAFIPYYYKKLTPADSSARTNILMSIVAMGIWAYAMGGPFALVGLYHPGVGGIILVAFTLWSGRVNP